MKKLTIIFLGFLALLTVCCKQAAKELQLAGSYKVTSMVVNDGTKDSIYENRQIKMYTSNHYIYAFLRADSSVGFGLGSYVVKDNNVEETNLYNGNGSDSAATYVLNITQNENGYTQVIPEITSGDKKYKMTETYAKDSGAGSTELDGLWKQTSAVTIVGNDTTKAATGHVQYKAFQNGHFIFVHRYATDSTGKTFKNGFGSGTFTYENGKLEEINNYTCYPSIAGKKISIAVTLNGKREFTQVISDEATKSTSIETYIKL